jgi:hypothetical protein
VPVFVLVGMLVRVLVLVGVGVGAFGAVVRHGDSRRVC